MAQVTKTEGGAGATGMKMRVTGASVQEVGTPRAFIDAVEKRIGAIAWDLAANETNHVVDGYFGPGSSYGDDAFRMVWHAPPACCGSTRPTKISRSGRGALRPRPAMGRTSRC